MSVPAPRDPATVSITLAMATYRRPDHVQRIVPLLVEQASSIPLPVRVVVVDNDPDGAASQLFDNGRYGAVEYIHESRAGISAARNRALRAAADDDLIVFIDDDEEPVGDWLARLVDAWDQYRCAAVAGPVEAYFERQPDPWVSACGVFDRRVRVTGTSLGGAASNNLLLDLRRLRALDLRFDNRFGLSGGSDTLLTHTLVSMGEQIRWCDEAVVRDFIPADRATRSWALRRVRRTSNTWSRVAIELAGSGWAAGFRVRADLAARGTYRFGRGLAHCLRGVLTNDLGPRARGMCEILEAVGIISGAFGVVRSEYRRDSSLAPAPTGTEA